MVPTSSRETSLLFENNKVKSRLLSEASSSRWFVSWLLFQKFVVVRKKQPKFFAFLRLQFFSFLLLEFFSFLLRKFFAFCFEATQTTRRGVSFPPSLADTQTTTRSRDEKIKINGTTRTTGVRKTFILYILYIQRDACEREFTRDETEETRALLRVKLLSVRFRLRVHTIDTLKRFPHETF